jgi:TonB-linked SusC/RagA family outer membrane protein
MKKSLLLLVVLLTTMSYSVYAQKVSGKVVGLDKEPLPGAYVLVKGTTTGTVTDENGVYSLSTALNNTLVFSFTGFQTLEVPIDGRTVVDVTMLEAAAQLGEVVVTALGMTKAQKALGYASSTVKSEDLTNAGTPNVATALYGKALGVRIAATPGGATSAVNIVIRGVNSITGRSQPLIVLDGVPIRDGEVNNSNYWGDQRLRGNGLLDINPQDVESITTLKGASAAALYGSEAVNGVLLITTKTGKGRKGTNVDFSANYGVDEVAYLPRYQNVRGAGAPIHVSNGGQDAEGFIYYDTNGDGSKETRGILPFTINFGPKFDGKPTMSWDGVIRPYEAQTDNYAGLFQRGSTSNINLAISQSGESGNIRFSLTRQDNKGLSLGSLNEKNIANLNSSFKFSKKWTADMMVNYVNQKTTNRPYSVDRMINNFTGMIGRFDNSEWYLNKFETSRGYRYVTGASGQSLTPNENIIYNGFRGDLADYVWRVKRNLSDEFSNRVIASMTHHYEILPSLRFRGRLSTDFTSERVENRNFTERPLAFGNSGGFSMANNLYSILYGDALLTYTKKISPSLELSVMGGYMATKDIASTISRGTNGGLSTENLFDIAASVNIPNNGSSRSSLLKDAIIGTINLDYKGFWFMEGTVRRDRTSTMNPENNSFVYPSVNTSFILSEALELPNFVSFAKVFGSWGVVGNYPDIYRANIAYNQGTLGVQQVGGAPVLFTNIPGAFGNDLIRPEQKNEYEFGIDTRFFKNRLSLEVSYYNGQIRDQILPLTLAATTGATSVLTNIGTLRNKGIEIGIKGSILKTNNLFWELGVNYYNNTNVVEKLANNATELLHADYDGSAAQLRSIVGQPMGDFYVPPVARHSNGQQIVNANGLYQLDSRSWINVGNAMPKATGGIFSTLNFKGITMDVMADFRLGGHVMPTGINWMISRGLLEESTKFMDKESGGLSYYVSGGKGIQTNADKGPNGEQVFNDGILLPGVLANGEPNTNVISQAYYYWLTYNWGGPQYGSSRYELYVVKNSYVKLREITLGYNIPPNVISKMGFKSLNLSVFGRNLFYFYRTIKDIDAEQLTSGSRWTQTVNNAGTNPSSRTMGVMIRASF